MVLKRTGNANSSPGRLTVIMKIGLTYTGSDEKHENYVRWLQSDAAIDVIRLSPGDSENLEGIDGLLLSGGTDIHPSFYGSQETNYPHAPSAFEQKRDEYEIALFNTAWQKKMPVLGVCRGFQLINCILGGELQQDLGGDKNGVHKARIDNHVQKDKAHGLDITTGTLLEKICGAGRFVVNSAHHQAVIKTGKGLRSNCIADDGTLEGVEWSDPVDKPFLLAIQWHPERMYKFHLEHSPVSKAIRDTFIEAIKNNHR